MIFAKQRFCAIAKPWHLYSRNAGYAKGRSTEVRNGKTAIAAKNKPAMTEKQKKIAVICTVTGVALLIIAVIALICNIVSIVGLSSRKAELERRSAELQEMIETKEDLYEYIRDNEEFFERYAREYLGYVYDGETVYDPS